MSDPDNNAPVDGVTLLISDHRRVSSLWQEARVATERREELIDLVVRELSVHDGIEKRALYPEVRTRVEGGQAMVERGLAEHQKVEELLAQAEAVGLGTEEAFLLMRQTMDNVVDHVAEEESSIFPALRASMSTEDLLDFGQRLVLARNTAPTHPHPGSPNEGVSGKVAGILGGLVDQAKDAVSGRPGDPDAGA